MTIDAPLTPHVAAQRREMVITRLFSFRGRFNRIQYIGIHFAWFFLAPFGWFIISLGTLAVLRSVSHDVAKFQDGAILAFTIPWLIACAWVYIATLVKRFHDIDWSGASCLLILIPFVGLFFIFALVFIRGTNGPNRYGEPPASVDG